MERLYRLRDLPGTALLMPVLYIIRDSAADPPVFLGGVVDAPAMTKEVVEHAIRFGRANGYHMATAAVLAESLLNRYRTGQPGATMAEESVVGLKVSVVFNPPQPDGMPVITGEILAWVDPDGEVYRGNDPEGDHVSPGWFPFAFA